MTRRASRPSRASNASSAPGQISVFPSGIQAKTAGNPHPETVALRQDSYASTETPAEHIRNALQILTGAFTYPKHVTLDRADFDAVLDRLLTAAKQLEVRTRSDAELREIALDFAGEAGRFARGEPERQPTADERAGMDWWNGLSEMGRVAWLARSGGKGAAEAWAFWKQLPAWQQETP